MRYKQHRNQPHIVDIVNLCVSWVELDNALVCRFSANIIAKCAYGDAQVILSVGYIWIDINRARCRRCNFDETFGLIEAGGTIDKRLFMIRL